MLIFLTGRPRPGPLTASTDMVNPGAECRRFFKTGVHGDSASCRRPRIDRRRGAGASAPLLLSILAPFSPFFLFVAFDDEKILFLACRAGAFRRISAPSHAILLGPRKSKLLSKLVADSLRIGLFWSSTGNTVSNIQGAFTGPFRDGSQIARALFGRGCRPNPKSLCIRASRTERLRLQ